MDGLILPDKKGMSVPPEDLFPVIRREKLDAGEALCARVLTRDLAGDKPFMRTMRLDEREVFRNLRSFLPDIPGRENAMDHLLQHVSDAVHASRVITPMPQILLRVVMSMGPLAPH